MFITFEMFCSSANRIWCWYCDRKLLFSNNLKSPLVFYLNKSYLIFCRIYYRILIFYNDHLVQVTFVKIFVFQFVSSNKNANNKHFIFYQNYCCVFFSDEWVREQIKWKNYGRYQSIWNWKKKKKKFMWIFHWMYLNINGMCVLQGGATYARKIWWNGHIKRK